MVCCVMLTADRPAMARRAVNSFLQQTYEFELRTLYFYDTGVTPATDSLPQYYPDFRVRYHRALSGGISLGERRNIANSWNSDMAPDIFIHWDDDDWSHPNRIAEQVELLQSSGAECVGYREMLFWDATRNGGEAWLYTTRDPRYCLGTSLCYWRRTWERKPFPDLNTGEDTVWLTGMKSIGAVLCPGIEPRMIASIHGRNLTSRVIESAEEWKRVPEWDERVREIMETK